MRHFGWPVTFGVVGGIGVEEQLHKSGVHRGCIVGAPTTGSTGTESNYDFNVNISGGVITVDGKPLEIAPEADIELASDSSASPLSAGESIIYSLVAWLSKGDGVVRTKWVAGEIAADAECVRPATASITAGFAEGTVWFIIGETKIHQDDATTIVQTYNNTTAPLPIPRYQPNDL